MNTLSTRGRTWFDALRGTAPVLPGLPPSVLASDALLGDHPTRLVAVVPDPANPYRRARLGEVGLREGWTLARTVRDAMAQDAHGPKRLLLAIVDVPSQAYGRREELLGIHLACAAAVDAYVSARMHGHPHPPDMTRLRESARYMNALHHIAGLGQDSGNLNLPDPTDYCARS